MKKTIFIGLLFLCLVHLQAQNFEVRMLRSIHSDSTVFKDKLFKGFSASAGPVAVAAPATLILTGFINKDDAMKRQGYRSGATFILSTVLTVGIKYSFRRERPWSGHRPKSAKRQNRGSLPADRVSVEIPATSSAARAGAFPFPPAG